MTHDKLKQALQLEAAIADIKGDKAHLDNIFNLVREGSKASLVVATEDIYIPSDLVRDMLKIQAERLQKKLERLEQEFKEL